MFRHGIRSDIGEDDDDNDNDTNVDNDDEDDYRCMYVNCSKIIYHI